MSRSGSGVGGECVSTASKPSGRCRADSRWRAAVSSGQFSWCSFGGSTRVVIDGTVIEEDDSRRTIALDPYTLGVLRSRVRMLDAERALAGEHYQDHGLLFCWEDGRPPHPDTITVRVNRLADAAGLPRIRLHDVRHSYATAMSLGGIAPTRAQTPSCGTG